MSKETTKRSGFTRRQALKAGAAGAAFTAAAGIGPSWLKQRGAWAADLAPGMTGGPTGFAGAERYQYDDTMSEGRAVAAARKLKAEGKAPDVLRILMTDGAIGHFTKPVAGRRPDAAIDLGARNRHQDRVLQRLAAGTVQQGDPGRDHQLGLL